MCIRDRYCPVHWQISDVIKLNDNTRYLYENDLSLLCDQRYGIEQMRTILSALKEFEMCIRDSLPSASFISLFEKGIC